MAWIWLMPILKLMAQFAMGFNREKSNPHALSGDTRFCGKKLISEDGIPPRFPLRDTYSRSMTGWYDQSLQNFQEIQ